MSLGVRLLLLALLLVGVGSFVFFLGEEPAAGGGAAGGGGEGVAAMRWESSEQCQQCHQQVWDEWHGSHHQIAYLNPEVRALSDDFRNKDCQACHLPRPIAITGFGKRTLPRSTTPNEGVSCLTCHLGAQGEIMARNDRPDLPCKPVANEVAMEVTACQSCHNQHQTTDQYLASHYPAEGVSCASCHMQPVDRAHGGKGFHHGFPGAHDIDMLRKAGAFVVAVEGGELVLSLENVNAGHNFPTEERHRAVDMEYRFIREGEDGDETWERAYRFRQPYRDEPGPNTQLPAGEKKEVRVAVPEGATAAVARLWYRLTPYVGDDDPKSTLLFEERVELR